MKPNLRILFIAAAAFAGCLAAAQDFLIVRVTDPALAYPIAGAHNLTVVDRTVGAPFVYYRTAVGSIKANVVAELQGDNRVVWVEDDDRLESAENQSGGKGSTVAVVNDRTTLYSFNSTMLSKISFDPNRAFIAGRTVKIAILDTGLARKSFALWKRVSNSANYVEAGASAYDQPKGTDTNGNSVPDEGVGHGTFVAGLVDQVAPLCPLVIVRVADSDGVSTAWRIIKGIAFSVTSGAEVANVSLGANHKVNALSDVCDWANSQGLLIVAAAGNDNTAKSHEPAGIRGNVCVTGVDANDRKASFANWESGVSTCAPATGIKSAWIDGTSVIWQGTSFSTPLVAAGIADSLRRRARAFPSDLQRAASRAGDGINAINPDYNGKLGVRLNLTKLDNNIKTLKNRP